MTVILKHIAFYIFIYVKLYLLKYLNIFYPSPIRIKIIIIYIYMKFDKY